MQCVSIEYCVWRIKQPNQHFYGIFLIKGCIFSTQGVEATQNNFCIFFLCRDPAMLLTNKLFYSYFRSILSEGVEFLIIRKTPLHGCF